jgi:hypothetical protein
MDENMHFYIGVFFVVTGVLGLMNSRSLAEPNDEKKRIRTKGVHAVHIGPGNFFCFV